MKIWSYYGLFEPRVYLENGSILPESLKNPDTGFGQGPGYIRSLLLTWTVTLAVIMVILALAFFKVP